MSKSNHPGLTEDLYITGAHAVLYDTLSEKEEQRMERLIDHFQIDYPMTLDGKQKLIAFYDDNFNEWNEEGTFTIYHLVLESKTAYRNYAIYANGILVESTDEITMSRMNHYGIVNLGYKIVEDAGYAKELYGTKINGSIQAKLEQIGKHHLLYKEEDLIKKKEILTKEMKRRNQIEEEEYNILNDKPETRSVTQKRYKKPTHFTIKHYL
jgi:hypothetical protein